MYELETTKAVRGGGKGGATHLKPPVLLGPLERHDSLPTLEQLGLHNNPERPVPCDCLLFVREFDFLTCCDVGGGDGEDVGAVEACRGHRNSRQLGKEERMGVVKVGATFASGGQGGGGREGGLTGNAGTLAGARHGGSLSESVYWSGFWRGDVALQELLRRSRAVLSRVAGGVGKASRGGRDVAVVVGGVVEVVEGRVRVVSL